MKIWKLIALLLLTTCVAACDDDPAEEVEGGNGGTTAEQVNVGFGYDAKTVLRNAGQVLVPVKLEKKVNSPVKVTVDALGGDNDTDAREGIDFNITEKVVTVPVGDTVAYIPVDLLDNQKADDNRVINLNITGVYGGKVGTQKTCALHIVSNAFIEFENANWETYESSSNTSASETIRNSRFVPLAITGEVTEASTVVFGVTDSTAVEPTHFTVVKEVVVHPGDTRVMVEITTVDDNLINEDRVFTLYVKEVKGGNLLVGKTAQSCKVKILSEEVRRILSFGVTAAQVTDKAQEVLVPISLDKDPESPVTLKIASIASSTAQEGVDYELVTKELILENTNPVMVKVNVLGDKELNSDRKLVLQVAEISGENIFIHEKANSFTLDIFNDDMAFEEEVQEVAEDETHNITISIPAVDRDRTITLSYKNNETAPGTYFVTPSKTISVPAGVSSVSIPMQVKYTTEFPTVAPKFTIEVVKLDDFTLEKGTTTSLVLAPCAYRNLIGDWDFKIGSYDGNGVKQTNLVRNMTLTMKEWKKSFTASAEWIIGWGVKAAVVEWNAKTGNAVWKNDVPMYTNVGFGPGVDVYFRTAVQEDKYWSAFKADMPLVWNEESKTFTWDISPNFGLQSDFRLKGTTDDGNAHGTWFIFKNLSITKK